MGLFSGIFGSSESSKESAKISVPWIQLEMVEQLEDIRENSKAKTQIIFKHSTTCGISRMVLNMFNANYEVEESQVDIYFLDLLANRTISNEVANIFNVPHQSPQLLIIKNETVVHHDSHGAISEIDLKKYL